LQERLELEVVLCVVIADILNHAIEALLVVRKQSLLNVVAEQVTEKTAEILMTWIREE
jgi:alcohol dehydrogenase class IV